MFPLKHLVTGNCTLFIKYLYLFICMLYSNHIIHNVLYTMYDDVFYLILKSGKYPSTFVFGEKILLNPYLRVVVQMIHLVKEE